MAFTTPSLNDLVRTTESGIATAFGFESTALRKGVLKVLARVFAGVAYLLILFMRRVWKNGFISTADVESLLDFGTDFGLPNKPASYAKGDVTITATSSSVTIAQGVVLVDDDDHEFEVVASTSVTSSGTSVGVIAVESGSESNLDAGAALTFRDGTPSGLEDDVTVGDDGIVGGSKIEVIVNGQTEYWSESIEDYRARLLDYRQNQPCGGCAADYKSWAERFSAVSKCIVEANFPHAGAVTCVLAHFDDENDQVALSASDVSEVAAYVTNDVRRPITADVSVVGCTEKSLAFSINIYPNNYNVQDSVKRALRLALRAYTPGDTITCTALSADLRASSVAENVAVTAIGSGTSVTLNKTSASMELPVIGSVTWSTYG